MNRKEAEESIKRTLKEVNISKGQLVTNCITIATKCKNSSAILLRMFKLVDFLTEAIKGIPENEYPPGGMNKEENLKGLSSHKERIYELVKAYNGTAETLINLKDKTEKPNREISAIDLK